MVLVFSRALSYLTVALDIKVVYCRRSLYRANSRCTFLSICLFRRLGSIRVDPGWASCIAAYTSVNLRKWRHEVACSYLTVEPFIALSFLPSASPVSKKRYLSRHVFISLRWFGHEGIIVTCVE